jgi:hypothetical protein
MNQRAISVCVAGQALRVVYMKTVRVFMAFVWISRFFRVSNPESGGWGLKRNFIFFELPVNNSVKCGR